MEEALNLSSDRLLDDDGDDMFVVKNYLYVIGTIPVFVCTETSNIDVFGEDR